MRGKKRPGEGAAVVFRCSKEEREAYHAAAAANSVDLSEAIRRLLEMLRRGEVRV